MDRALPASEIIEAADNLLTVRTSRGDEFVIDGDQLAIRFAEMLSEQRHEEHMGWTLKGGWYREWFDKLTRTARMSSTL